MSGVNPETNEEVIIQLRIVERDLATLIGLNDYETLRLVEVLRRSRTLLLVNCANTTALEDRSDRTATLKSLVKV